MERVEGRAAVVTGAASGIGLAVSEALAAAGLRVLMTDLDGEALAQAASSIGVADAVPLDVRDPDAVSDVAQEVVDRFGGLHIAVNNAGIVNGGNSWELSLEEWHRVLDVNLWGVIHGVHAFVPRILATGEEGHVVNVASMAAVIARPGIAPYTVAKHGVLGLSDVLRGELEAASAPVGVSVVMPGAIRTGMNPIGTVEPSAVATNVLDAIRRGRPYVFTDDHSTEAADTRLRQIIASRADVLPG
ncbi:MAG: SDR family NAD(P)-dependent oxidoreductase [Acidimicrobiia bacterium]|nr:SDR family NAD(P)-dependent oxidoreductase [Acidimicrobiia bacterium]